MSTIDLQSRIRARLQAAGIDPLREKINARLAARGVATASEQPATSGTAFGVPRPLDPNAPETAAPLAYEQALYAPPGYGLDRLNLPRKPWAELNEEERGYVSRVFSGEYGEPQPTELPSMSTPGEAVRMIRQAVTEPGAGPKMLAGAYGSTAGQFVAGGASALGTGAELLGAPQTADTLRAASEGVADWSADLQATPAGRFGGVVGQGVQSVPLLVASRGRFAAPVAGGTFGAYGVQGYGAGARDYRATMQAQGRTPDPGAEALVGAAYAAAEIVFERFGIAKTGAAINKAAEGIAEGILRRDVPGLARFVMGMGEAAGVNAGEELATEIAQNAVSAFYDPSRDLLEGTGEAMTAGGMQGLMLGGGGGAVAAGSRAVQRGRQRAARYEVAQAARAAREAQYRPDAEAMYGQGRRDRVRGLNVQRPPVALPEGETIVGPTPAPFTPVEEGPYDASERLRLEASAMAARGEDPYAAERERNQRRARGQETDAETFERLGIPLKPPAEMTRPELRAELEAAGLPTAGTTTKLRERVAEARGAVESPEVAPSGEGSPTPPKPQKQGEPRGDTAPAFKSGDKLPSDFVYHNTKSATLENIAREGMTSGSFSHKPIGFGGDAWIAVRRSDIGGSVQEHDYGSQGALEPTWGDPAPGYERTPPIPADRIYLVDKRGKVVRRLGASPSESSPGLPTRSPELTRPQLQAEARRLGVSDRGSTKAIRERVEAQRASRPPQQPPQVSGEPEGSGRAGDDAPQPTRAASSPDPVRAAPETSSPKATTDYRSDISLDAATRAHSGTSFTPGKRGQQVIEDYQHHLESRREQVDAAAQSDPQKAIAESEFARFREGYRRRYLDWLNAKSRIVSTMIAGPANFPVRRMEKANAAEHKRMEELVDYDKRASAAMLRNIRDAATTEQRVSEEADRLIAVVRRLAGIMKTGGGQLFRQNAAGKLQRAAANGEHEAVRAALAEARRLQAEHGITLFADNNAVWKLAEKAELAKASTKTGTEFVGDYEGGISIERDHGDGRVRINFPGKPDEAMRTALKSEGWRWSPQSGAWQRMNTDASVQSAKNILERAGIKPKAPETEPPEPPPSRGGPSARPGMALSPQEMGKIIREAASAATKFGEKTFVKVRKLADRAIVGKISDEQRAEIRREVWKVIRSDPDRRPSYKAVEQHVRQYLQDKKLAAAPEVKHSTQARVEAITGVDRKPETVTTTEAMKARLQEKQRGEERTAKESAKAAAKARRDTLREQLPIMRAKIREAVAQTKGEAAASEGIKKELARLVQENAPETAQRRFLHTIANARTLNDLAKAVDRIMRHRARGEGAAAADFAAAATVGKPRRVLLPHDRRQVLALAARARSLKKRLFSEADTDTLRALAAELRGIASDIRAIQHQARMLRAEAVAERRRTHEETVARIVADVEASRPERKRNRADDLPSGGLRQWVRRSMSDIRNTAALIEGRDQGEIAKAMYDDFLPGYEGRYAQIRDDMAAAEALAKRAGFKNWADVTRTMTTDLGHADTVLVDVVVGGKTHRITLGEMMEIAARDAQTTPLLDGGLPQTIKRNRSGGIKMTAAERRQIAQDFEKRAPGLIAGLKEIIQRRKGPAFEAAHRLRGEYPEEVGPDYWPRARDRSGNPEKAMPKSVLEFSRKFLENLGLLEERQADTKTPMLIRNGISVFEEHITHLANLTHLAEPVRRAAALLDNPDVRLAVSRRHGTKAYQALQTHLSEQSMANEDFSLGWWTRLARLFGTGKSIAALAMSPTSMAKNLGGTGRLMAVMTNAEAAAANAATARGFSGIPSTAEIRAKSGYFWARFRHGGLTRMGSPVLSDPLATAEAPAGESIKGIFRNIAAADPRGAFRNWRAFGQAVFQVYNLTDQVLARQAWAGAMASVDRSLTGAARDRAIARRAEQLFRDSQNPSDHLDQPLIALETRRSGASGIMLFTSDSLKARNRLIAAARQNRLGRAVAGEALNQAWASAVGKAIPAAMALFGSLIGGDDDELEKAIAQLTDPAGYGKRMLRESSGIVAPIVLPDVVGLATGEYRGEPRLLSVPIMDTATELSKGAYKLIVNTPDVWAGDDEALTRWLRALDQTGEALREGLGDPTVGPYRLLRRAYRAADVD